MTRDDIIRKFLELHPDTPIDGQKYATPLRIISRMLEVAAAAERESCAEVAEKHFTYYGYQYISDDIRARENALTKLNKAAEDIGEEL